MTPSALGLVTVNVAAGVAQDALGNASARGSASVFVGMPSVLRVDLDASTTASGVSTSGQRSTIRRIRVTLSNAIPGLTHGQRFSLVAGTAGDVGGVPVTLAHLGRVRFRSTVTYLVNGNGTATLALAFGGASLVNGNYRLTVGEDTTAFHRLLGDFTGDRRVTVADLNLFVRYLTTTRRRPPYNAAMDFNGDGIVNFRDLAVMKARIGSRLAAPVG